MPPTDPMKTQTSKLAQAGIPYSLWEVALAWGKDWPGSSTTWEDYSSIVSDIPGLYSSGTNLVIAGSDRLGRMKVVADLAKNILGQDNAFYRHRGEHKHNEAATFPDGTPAPLPFSVKMVDMEQLEAFYKACDRDDESFPAEVREPDFYFVTEIGSEWSNTFTARILMQLITARLEEGLPTVITISKRLRDIQDKNGNLVYKEIGDLVQGAFRKVKLSD